jgi:hypothetical protein
MKANQEKFSKIKEAYDMINMLGFLLGVFFTLSLLEIINYFVKVSIEDFVYTGLPCIFATIFFFYLNRKLKKGAWK